MDPMCIKIRVQDSWEQVLRSPHPRRRFADVALPARLLEGLQLHITAQNTNTLLAHEVLFSSRPMANLLRNTQGSATATRGRQPGHSSVPFHPLAAAPRHLHCNYAAHNQPAHGMHGLGNRGVIQVARFNSSDKQAQPSGSAAAPDFEASVEEIMGRAPVQLKQSTPCKEAARLLLEHDISSAPVVDDAGKLVGVLSETDLLWKGAGAPLDHTIVPPVYVGAFDLLISLRDSTQVKQEVDKILARTVGQAMSKSPASISPSASLSQAAQLMLAKKVHSLPVVDADHKVIGIVTQHDVLRGMVAEQLPLL